MRIRYFLSLFLVAAVSSVTLAADVDGVPKTLAERELAPNSYIGEGLRIGVGYDSKSKLRGEYYQVLREDSAKAFIGEAWVSGSAAGFKLNHHWVAQSDPQSDSVRKLFIALDQNEQHDRKFTVGGGAEYTNWFWGSYLSHGLTARHQISSTTATQVENVPGTENGRSYFQEMTTATITRIFERPYDYGIGLMAGHFYEPALLRIYTRLDHEWGRSSASQDTFGIGVEKFFADSPVSVALNAEAYRKKGDFEPKQNDQRVNLVLRYEFGGKSYRPAREARLVAVTPTNAAADAAVLPPTTTTVPVTGAVTLHDSSKKTEQRMVKTTASMSADAFFNFDKSTITPEARTALEDVVARLKSSGYTGNIRLTGHTCDIGPAAYNQKLSERRATAVKEYMASHGVAPDTIVVEGKGEMEPRYPNNSSASRQKNRRVDMEFVSYVEKMEAVLVPGEGKPAVIATPSVSAAKPASPAIVKWRTEYIDSEPAWLRRALHNTVRHKQTVDVYRQVEQTRTVTNGVRNYVNTAPLAVNDVFQVPRNSSNNLLDVLKNDSDPDSDSLRILSVQTPAHGTASISGNRIAYTPTLGYVGADNFSYTITDDNGGTATATISVTVSFVNSAPIAVNDAYQVVANSSNNLFDVLKNDSDPDGDPLNVAAVQSPAHGKVSISANRIMYTPTLGYVGADSFTYTITDGNGGTATATISVTVSSVNSAPIAVNDAFEVVANSSNNLFDVLKNDSDPDGDPLNVAAVQPPAHGKVSISANRIMYTPTLGYVGADSFTYTVSDNQGLTATASVSVMVTASPNSPPVAVDDESWTIWGQPIRIYVLANDSDPNGDPLTITSIGAVAHGTATINGYNIIYTSSPTFTGEEVFTYTISDGRGGTATATVRVTVVDP